MVVKAVTTASGGVQSPPFFCVQFTGNDDPTPWPYRHTIRYKFMDDVPAVVQDILRSTIDEWLKSQPTPQIYVQRVETGDADVRFGLTASGVTLCALGKNVPDSQQQPTVLLGLRTWKADESEVVWTHSEMERMARHVWGHVLGLPHAPSEYSYEWKDAALNEVCSATGITKSQITQPRGNSKLDASDSVMHYDRPSELVASPVSYRERVGNVDSKAIRLLNELYPSPREFEVVHQWCSNMPGWKETWTEQKMLVREYTKNWSAGSRISALNYVDLGTNSYYQACVHAQPTDNPKVVTLNMGAYSTESHIVNLKASFLLWNTPDSGVQTGTEKTSDIRGSWWTTAQGEKFEKRIQFAQPFKSTPKVLNFIYAFCVEKGNWIRISVFPKDVSNTGFTMCLHSWADTICHNISACWVAHEADDPTIRSGRWEPPEHWGPWATEDSATLEYYSPLSARPREIFCGFNHVNVRGGVNARFKCDALRWSERSVDMKISTWEQESAYHNMGASYIALL